MSYGRGVALFLLGYAGLAWLLRPHGARLLEAASSGTREGAFVLGLLMWLVPIALGTAWALERHAHPGRGTRTSLVLGTACWVGFTPLLLVPVLGSRSASDTSFELSVLFEPWLAGFGVGMVLLFAVLGVLRLTGRYP